MARSGTKLDESLLVAGGTTTAVLERVRIAFGDLPGYQVASPSPDVVQLTKLTRSLLAKRTSHCTVRAVSEPRGLVVTMIGELNGDDVDLLRAAVGGTSREQAREEVVATFRPPTDGVGAAPFVPPADWFVGSAPAAPTVVPNADPVPSISSAPIIAGVPHIGLEPQPAPVVEDDDDEDKTQFRGSAGARRTVSVGARRIGVTIEGRGEIELGSLMLIGRDPKRRTSDADDAALVGVDDPAMSKTHVSIGTVGDRIWVEDRGSKNGTDQVLATGEYRALDPNVRVTLDVPTVLIVGDTTVAVGWMA